MLLSHLIVTRFNIRSGGAEQQIRLQPGWLDKRFELFEAYCLPCVEGQTKQDFRWVVLFDTLTPDSHRERIAGYQRRYSFDAEFTDSGLMDHIAPAIAARICTTDWLLTTRLDSDDILASDFVERLHATCERREKRVINFDNGLILSIDGNQRAAYAHVDKCNPFASYLEPASDRPTTIWGASHREIARLGPIEHLGDPPAWMQVVHGGNVTNSVRGRRVPLRSATTRFPKMQLDERGAAEPILAIAGDNLIKRPLRIAQRTIAKVRRQA